jgi:hypothetical protein
MTVVVERVDPAVLVAALNRPCSPRIVGSTAALELTLTAGFIDAAEAARIGLVHRVVSDTDLVEEAMAIAKQVTANGPFGVKMTDEVMWAREIDPNGLLHRFPKKPDEESYSTCRISYQRSGPAAWAIIA